MILKMTMTWFLKSCARIEVRKSLKNLRNCIPGV